MKTFLICCMLILLPVIVHADEYNPDKRSSSRAAVYCMDLIIMTKTPSEAGGLLLEVRAKIHTRSKDGKKVIIASYNYNTKGAGYACAFLDYTDGHLQLLEFGELWPAGNKNTIVNPLY